MLSTAPSSPSVVTTDIERAKKFYGNTLGLKLVNEEGPVFYQLNGGTTLMVYPRDNAPTADHTLVHWWVPNLDTTVDQLTAKGVKFERYPGMKHDKRGIADMSEEGGPRAAWFTDPDGNIFGLMQR